MSPIDKGINVLSTEWDLLPSSVAYCHCMSFFGCHCALGQVLLKLKEIEVRNAIVGIQWRLGRCRTAISRGKRLLDGRRGVGEEVLGLL